MSLFYQGKPQKSAYGTLLWGAEHADDQTDELQLHLYVTVIILCTKACGPAAIGGWLGFNGAFNTNWVISRLGSNWK